MLYIELSQSMAADSSFCQQRALAQLYNMPLTRFTPTNPYLSNTKFQLDMRRKVEILKYSPNKSSTQTNNLTKKQKYASLVKGKFSPSSQTQVKNSQNVCGSIPMLTTSSNVPGPAMYLYLDESVPLYNYSVFNIRTYPDYVPPNSVPWQFIVLDNVLIYDNGTNNINYLIISNSIDQPQYNYKITTPIALSVVGKVPSLFATPITAFIKIKTAALYVYYNNSLVKTLDPFSIENMDISVNILDNPGLSSVPFSTTNFIGNLLFENLLLYTASTYVYTFSLKVDLELIVTPINVDITNMFTYIATIANVLPSTAFETTGCTVTQNPLNMAINTGSFISLV